MAVTDFAGTWEYKGTLNPTFNDWQQFPQGTNSGNSLIRLTYYGDMSKVKTYGYIRCLYSFPNNTLDTRWKRIFPKSEPEVLDMGVPQELLITSESVSRYFQVIKKLKPAYRRQIGTVFDESWALSIEVLELLSLSDQLQDAILEENPKVLNLANKGNLLVVIGGNQNG